MRHPFEGDVCGAMEETFRVEFLGFVGARPQDGHLVLASAFGLTEEQAKLLVVTAPKVVATGVSRQRFDGLVHALSAVKVRLVTTNEQTGEKEQHPPAVSLPLLVDEQPVTMPPGSGSYKPPGHAEQAAKPPAPARRRSSGHYASVGSVKSDRIPPRRKNPSGGHQASGRTAPSGSHPDVPSKAPSGSYAGASSSRESGGYEEVGEGPTSGSLPIILKQIERSGAYTATDYGLSIDTVFEGAGDGLVPPEKPNRSKKNAKRLGAKEAKKTAAKRAKTRAEKYRSRIVARATGGSDSRGRIVMLIVAVIVVLGCLIYLVL